MQAISDSKSNACMLCEEMQLNFRFLKVPLGIILKNENKIDEMVQILSELQQYVSFAQKTVEVDVDGEDEPHELIIDRFHSILLGGDQLTVSRIRSAQAARLNSECGSGQLRGFTPVVEDWHAKLSLMEVFNSCCYMPILRISVLL